MKCQSHLEGSQVKNGQFSDGRGGVDPQEGGIHRNWMSRATISISVIRVQTVFQMGVWLSYKCSRLVYGSAISALDNILGLFLAFQVRRVCLGFTAECRV